jgi:DNA-binding NtrC family response regulator
MAGERDLLVTARLAEEAMGGPYAPSARVAFDTIERRVRLGAPLVVVAPSGSSVVSYLARAHLAGPRSAMPFVVVDGAKASEHDVARWSNASQSPLALAERGVLVIADAARWPNAVQQLLADALAQRRAPWEGAGTLDVTLALLTAGDRGSVRAELDPALAARLDDALIDLVEWPHLRERGEDLRSLVLAGLAREGVRMRGAPLGIEDAAFEELANHAYPGEDAELGSIVRRLARVATGNVVTAGDVRTLGLGRGESVK